MDPRRSLDLIAQHTKSIKKMGKLKRRELRPTKSKAVALIENDTHFPTSGMMATFKQDKTTDVVLGADLVDFDQYSDENDGLSPCILVLTDEKWTDENIIKNALSDASTYGDTLVYTGCTYADDIAHEWCKNMDFDIVRCSDNKRSDPSYSVIQRNMRMFKYNIRIVLLFCDSVTACVGARDIVKRAERAHITVAQYRTDGTHTYTYNKDDVQ